MNKVQLGQRIREIRLQKGYTQRTLAEKAKLADVYLSEIERGAKMPSMNSFIRLMEALDVSADYVLRHELSSGQCFVCNDLSVKLESLTPQQRKTVSDIIDAYLRNLD